MPKIAPSIPKEELPAFLKQTKELIAKMQGDRAFRGQLMFAYELREQGILEAIGFAQEIYRENKEIIDQDRDMKNTYRDIIKPTQGREHLRIVK